MKKFPLLEDREWMNKKYWEEELSVDEMAVLAGCSCAAMSRAITRKGIPRRLQHPQRLRERCAGEKSYAWKGGVRREPPGQSTRRKELLTERGNICQWCEGTPVDLHHVVPWIFSEDHGDENVLLLCKKCHTKADMLFTNMARSYFASEGYPKFLDAVMILKSRIQNTCIKPTDSLSTIAGPK
jgi:hypothetical protein